MPFRVNGYERKNTKIHGGGRAAENRDGTRAHFRSEERLYDGERKDGGTIFPTAGNGEDGLFAASGTRRYVLRFGKSTRRRSQSASRSDTDGSFAGNGRTRPRTA